MITYMFNADVFRNGRNITSIGGDMEVHFDMAMKFLEAYDNKADRIVFRFYEV